mmetsp:Transcript_11541/g.39809  ORF Transcript_11541/g.39809 Transcript_11541/m.39809 type:complete len:147 (+) Transcript_11541:662-1102(+)
MAAPPPPLAPPLPAVTIAPRPRTCFSLHRATDVHLDRRRLESLFHLPQPQAAQAVGISLTTFKASCRRLGVRRWPYKKAGRPGGEAEGTTSSPAPDAEEQESRQRLLVGSSSMRADEQPDIDQGWLSWYLNCTGDDCSPSVCICFK